MLSLSALGFVTALDGREISNEAMADIWQYLRQRGCRCIIHTGGRVTWYTETGYNLIFQRQNDGWWLEVGSHCPEWEIRELVAIWANYVQFHQRIRVALQALADRKIDYEACACSTEPWLAHWCLGRLENAAAMLSAECALAKVGVKNRRWPSTKHPTVREYLDEAKAAAAELLSQWERARQVAVQMK